ncbi:MAG: PH domain-containing protein, partial [Bryobacteraceae bacterium]
MRNWILGIMRVPPEPHPPEGSADSVRIFRAGLNYYRFRVLVWCLANLGPATGLVFLYLATRRGISRLSPQGQLVWFGLELLVLTIFLVSLTVSFFVQRLNFELRWYIVTDRSLRIRSGIWS